MAATALLVGAAVGIVTSTVANAEACPNETLRLQQRATGLPLPDCRAYEQVSPVQKTGVDAEGGPSFVPSAPSGGGVGFWAVEPFPGTLGSAQVPSYLALRSSTGDGWSTQGIEPLLAPGSSDAVKGVTEDLTKTVVLVREEQIVPCEPALVVCASRGENSAYVRDNATGSFQLLASHLGREELFFDDATPDGSKILFETKAELIGGDKPGVDHLYEWDESEPPADRLSLAGVLPGSPGEPAPEGSFAGLHGKYGAKPSYTQDTISQDGSRIFFGDAETGRLYMREPQAKPAMTVPVSNGIAEWLAATPSGSFVFYAEGGELHRFNVAEAKDEVLTTGAEGVAGTLGVSDDGSYAYFVAPGVLAANANANGEKAEENAANLYVWHEEAITFVARLQDTFAQEEGDTDWRGYYNYEFSKDAGPAAGGKGSRVTSDGRFALFSSTARPVGYENAGRVEFYLYDANESLSAHNPACVSCNPLGTPASSEARLEAENAPAFQPSLENPYLPRNLSDSGDQVFFDTEEGLVPEDKNGQRDVYEWEREGVGSCGRSSVGFSEQDGGCLSLISTGQSAARSYFGDASADGRDVFFFTRQSLVSQDQDDNADLYDARVEGGIPAQNPLAPAVPCEAPSACRSGESVSSPSVFGGPSSSTFSGPGNLGPPPSQKLTPAQVRAERLHRALRACRSKPRSKRKHCEVVARRKYGVKSKAKKAKKAKKANLRGAHS